MDTSGKECLRGVTPFNTFKEYLKDKKDIKRDLHVNCVYVTLISSVEIPPLSRDVKLGRFEALISYNYRRRKLIVSNIQMHYVKPMDHDRSDPYIIV